MKLKEHQDMSIDELIDEVLNKSAARKGIENVIADIKADPNDNKRNLPVLEKIKDEYLREENSAKAHLRDKRIDELLKDD